MLFGLCANLSNADESVGIAGVESGCRVISGDILPPCLKREQSLANSLAVYGRFVARSRNTRALPYLANSLVKLLVVVDEWRLFHGFAARWVRLLEGSAAKSLKTGNFARKCGGRMGAWCRPDLGFGRRILPPPFTKISFILNRLCDARGSEVRTGRSQPEGWGCQAVAWFFIYSLKSSECRSRLTCLSDWKSRESPGTTGVESGVIRLQSRAFFLSILPPLFTKNPLFIRGLPEWFDRLLAVLPWDLRLARLTHR